MIIPPVTLNAWPVPVAASADARNRAMPATSAGSAQRPSGDDALQSATISGVRVAAPIFVNEEVVRKAKCPVLTVKGTPKAKPGAAK